VSPGTFVHVPAYARHSMRATEDGDLQYLYIKDKTWTVVGLAEDEAVPDKAMTVAEVNRKYGVGEKEKHTKAQGVSQVIIEGLHDCYYPLLPSLDAPRSSARRVNWIEGERLAFGLFESPQGYADRVAEAPHETFIYVLSGTMHAEAGGESRTVSAGDVLHVPRGDAYSLVANDSYARYALVASTAYLENRIDSMTPAEAEQARLNMRPN
jgi:quercetin dioxygenase-like cupin family protein